MVIFYIFKINNIKIKTCFFFRYSGIEITITASPNKEAVRQPMVSVKKTSPFLEKKNPRSSAQYYLLWRVSPSSKHVH